MKHLLIIAALLITGCSGAGEQSTWTTVPGPTLQILAVYMHDNNLSNYADSETWFGSNSRVRLDSYVDYLDRPTCIKSPHAVTEAEEADSCSVRTIRAWLSETWDHDYDHHVIYIAGHGGGVSPEEGALAFGPDMHGVMDWKGDMSWLDVNGLSFAVENLGADLLVVDACSSLKPPLLEAMAHTDIPCIAGSTHTIKTNFIAPQHLAKVWSEHHALTMSELCEIAWGHYPLIAHVVRDHSTQAALTARRVIDHSSLRVFEPPADRGEG